MAAAVLVVAGALWHGVTIATFQGIWHDLIEGPTEPMRYRFVSQPLMAAIVAIRDGLKDVRAGRAPHFWKALGVARLREALNATARIILLGITMDAIFQVFVLKRLYPAEALIIALLLAFAPYFLIRGPTARIARRWHGVFSHR